jgi:steroid delta-isomerase-like uncharacterized protein
MPTTKEIAERFFDTYDTRDASKVVADVSNEFMMHLPGMPPLNAEQTEQFMAAWYNAFPDFAHERQHVITDGDKALVHVVGRGTHKGEFNGIPATGKPVTVEGFNLVRIENGKVAESWAQFDGLGLMQQLGVIPQPEPMTA